MKYKIFGFLEERIKDNEVLEWNRMLWWVELVIVIIYKRGGIVILKI